jgi:N-hydroxyarylamine O-acetyltransferase
VPPDRLVPRTHLLLLVDLDGEERIADVGFGGNTLTAPLRLRDRGEQATPNEPARIVENDGAFTIQVKIRGQWHDLVAFDLDVQNPAELEMGNWFTSTHPKSRFRNELFTARSEPGVRYGLLDNVLTTHRLEDGTEKRTLENAAEIREALINIFRIKLPDDPALEGALARHAGKAS